MGRSLSGGFFTKPSNRFSISHLLRVRPPIARPPNTKDAHAQRLSEALIGVAHVASAAGLASAGGGCGGCGSACLGSRRRPAAPLGPRPRPLASVRTKPLDEVHAAAAVAALRLIILRSSRGWWPRRAPSWQQRTWGGICTGPRGLELQNTDTHTHRQSGHSHTHKARGAHPSTARRYSTHMVA